MEKLRLKILHESEGWTVLRVISQPDPWPGDFEVGKISIASLVGPNFLYDESVLCVRGSDHTMNNKPIMVRSKLMNAIRQAVRAFNEKHASSGGEPADIIE